MLSIGMSAIGPVRSALIFSDVHLGWALCSRHHQHWLARLPEAVGDAELVVLNGDIVDGHRRVQRADERELVQRLAELVGGWRREGRRVVCMEGNHDARAAAADPLAPERWSLDFETHEGQRVRVLHGHRFAPSELLWGAYDRAGRTLLGLENLVYGRVAALRSLYRFGPGWLASAACRLECVLAQRALPARLAPLLAGVDALLHGHIHYGPGRGRIGEVATWRTGSWVSPGHLGSADRMLRYRAGRFERIGWSGGRWLAFDDGR
jgi:UDP-2,3-diacylglucosamine pyrophosphatase LpxH